MTVANCTIEVGRIAPRQRVKGRIDAHALDGHRGPVHWCGDVESGRHDERDAAIMSFPEIAPAARRACVARRAEYGTGSAGFTRNAEKGKAGRSNKRLRSVTVILSRHTQPASARRPPSPSWGRPEAVAPLRSDLLQEGLEEPPVRPAFRVYRDGHAVCPCPFAGRRRS